MRKATGYFVPSTWSAGFYDIDAAERFRANGLMRSVRFVMDAASMKKGQASVYDIADLWKLDTVVPEAFRIAGQHAKGKVSMAPERAVRLACRDAFRRTGLLTKIVPQIEEVLSAGDLPKPEPPPEALGPAFTDPEHQGDDGHRG